MTHFTRLSQIVIDVPDGDHDAEVGFWREAVGVPFKHYEQLPAFHGGRLEGQFGMLVQRLGDGAAKVHLDLHTTDPPAEVARLIRLGATVVDDSQDWTVMRDPAGLVFCVVPDPRLDATNAQAVE